MTNWNPDYHCAVCRRYLFSGYANDHTKNAEYDKQRHLCDACRKKEAEQKEKK